MSSETSSIGTLTLPNRSQVSLSAASAVNVASSRSPWAPLFYPSLALGFCRYAAKHDGTITSEMPALHSGGWGCFYAPRSAGNLQTATSIPAGRTDSGRRDKTGGVRICRAGCVRNHSRVVMETLERTRTTLGGQDTPR